MKNLVLLLLLTTLLSAQEYREFAHKMGYETSYERAMEKAKKENKNIMFFMITNYCPWCSKMEKRVLSNLDVDKTLKAKFIPLILNKEEKNFPKEFDVAGSPVTYLIEQNQEKVYDKRLGYMNKKEFLNFIK
ncbi:thioredoxin family protein [Candidatus Sulfurimonas baltica]|uniref:Thioredoxin family protein n=1 Tax=Candidatus Sulfurimonas baltica TaxID=2740404 RepID=A0A7S7LVQ4_9BACT|nr:thioredoxin family protein [Candidatus Sulfurimonas baltica]QOY52236.1 thioredoxin family protein [Candidatus Sulfurimonas baltica]